MLDDFLINVEVIILAHVYNAHGESYPAKMAADIDASALSGKSRHAIEQIVLRKLRKLEKNGLVKRQQELGDPEQLGRALRNYCQLTKDGESTRRKVFEKFIDIPSLMNSLGKPNTTSVSDD